MYDGGGGSGGGGGSSSAKDLKEELASGRVISYTQPDEYVVEWDDGTTSVFGFSDLFSPGELPKVLPLSPEVPTPKPICPPQTVIVEISEVTGFCHMLPD